VWLRAGFVLGSNTTINFSKTWEGFVVNYKKDHERWFGAINDYLSKRHGVTIATLRFCNYHWELAYCTGLKPSEAIQEAIQLGLELPKKKNHPSMVDVRF
jgi:hypothetical protein